MLSWFGGGAKRDSTAETIVNLRAHLDTLQKKASFYEEKRDQQEQLARQLVTTNKVAAKNALRKKKRHEEELEKLENQILAFEQQLSALESANLNRETMKYMKQSADTLRNINKGMNADKLDETMDDLRDQVGLSDEISNAISQPIHDTDEAELEADLENLEQEALDDHLVHANKPPSTALPEVPKQQLSSGNTADEDEEEALRQLEAEMAA